MTKVSTFCEASVLFQFQIRKQVYFQLSLENVLAINNKFQRKSGAPVIHQSLCSARYKPLSDERLIETNVVCKNCAEELPVPMAQTFYREIFLSE